MEWKHVFPKKPGYYWFAGERYGRNDFAKEHGQKPDYEVTLCRVQKIGKGVIKTDGSNTIMTGNGQFVEESEFGDEWLFAPADVPEMPKFSGK